MKLSQFIGKSTRIMFILSVAFCPMQLRADITVKEQIKQGGVVPSEVWTRKLLIKGFKMRVESLSGKESYVTIYDLETGKRVRLSPKRKEALVMDLAPLSERMRGRVVASKLARQIRATGNKKEVAGESCEEYTFDLQAPIAHFAVQHDKGTVCVSQNMPGGVEFTNFVHEAKKRGYTDPASFCSPTVSSIGSYFYGEEPNVMVLFAKTESAAEGGPVLQLHGMTALESTMTVTEIDSTSEIPDEEFQIPADWKVKKDSM